MTSSCGWLCRDNTAVGYLGTKRHARLPPTRTGYSPDELACGVMPPRIRKLRRSQRNVEANMPGEPAAGAIYGEMLREAEAEAAAVSSPTGPERPLKRPRPNSLAARQERRSSGIDGVRAADQTDEMDQTAPLVDRPPNEPPPAVVQTVLQDYGSDEDEDEDDEEDFEDVPPAVLVPEAAESGQAADGKLEINLTGGTNTAPRARNMLRRKPLTKEEKSNRANIHKAHILCLMSHCARRNHWCNDMQVQERLRPLLSEKMVKYLNPSNNLSQFGRTESLKNGLGQVNIMYRIKFTSTERGIRRALWAEDVDDLANVRCCNQEGRDGSRMLMRMAV